MITLLKLNLWVFLIQLDVTSAQLLVTDNDFRDPEFRKQLTDTVESLLDLKVVPIFNENDAVSTRRAPYEVYLLLWLRLHICKVKLHVKVQVCTLVQTFV